MVEDENNEKEEEINFSIGKKFTNRKGDFVVVSISGNKMNIKWDHGETIETTVDQQERIIKNMAFEKKQKEEALNKPKKSVSKARNKFKGLEETDFSHDITGTTWRNRTSLSGLVTRNLDSKDHKFLSHPVYRKSGVVWQDETHRNSKKVKCQAKFFARIDESDLNFGFSVDRTTKNSDEKRDWNSFIHWLEISENEEWFKSQVAEQSLKIVLNLGEKSLIHTSSISSKDDMWLLAKGDTNIEYSSILNYLNSLSEDLWINLQVVKLISKDDALNQKHKIGSDISTVFNLLMPMYVASIEEYKETA